jgi:hypothetical protein
MICTSFASIAAAEQYGGTRNASSVPGSLLSGRLVEDMHAGESAKIRLGVSSCLLGERVRYDGGHKRDAFLNDILMEALAVRATRARHVNVLQYMAGFFKRQLRLNERAELVEMLEDYRRGTRGPAR